MNIKKIFISSITIVLAIFILKYNTEAMPACSQWENVKLSNGQTVKLKLRGDEKLNYYKTTSDEVLIKGKDSDFYYGDFKDGSVVSSQVKYGDYYSNKLTEDKLQTLKNNYFTTEAKKYNKIYNLMDFKGIEYKSLSSTRPVLVVLVEFNDRKLTYDEGQWYNEFFGQTSGTVYDYYDKASKGKFHFSPGKESYGTVNDGIIKISLNSNHPNFGSNFGQAEDTLRQSVMNEVNGYVNFADFDLNNDGNVSQDEISINIIVAGYESSCGSKSPSIWGHESRYYMYGDGKNLSINYTMQGEIHEIEGDHRASIGIFCHELGHALGLPDLYDYDGSSDGIGMHSIMAGGSWGKGSYYGDTPTRFDPWSLYYLGFTVPAVISSSGDYSLNSNWNDYNIYKILTSNPNEYFLIENREFNGYDASLKYQIKSGGIGIYHVDESVLISTNFYGCNNDEKHKSVDVEEANEGILGYSELDTSRFNNGDHFYYDSGNATFSQNTIPNSNLYNNAATGIEVFIKSSPASIMNISVILPGSQYKGGKLEKPLEAENLSGSYDITGYYVSDSIIQKLLVYLDGNEVTLPLDINMWRRDINEKFGNVGEWGNKRTGFKGTLDTTKYSNGSHSLSVKLLLSNGNTIDLGSKNVIINNTTSPVSSFVLLSTPNNTINVTDYITFNFNNAIKAIDVSKIKLQVNGNYIYFCYYIYGNQLIIKPDNYFKGNSSYNLTLDSGALTDSYGQKLSQLITFDFNTLNSVVTSQDLNGDGVIDIKDIALMSKSYNSNSKNSLFNYKYDLNFDEVIDLFDLVNLSKKL